MVGPIVTAVHSALIVLLGFPQMTWSRGVQVVVQTHRRFIIMRKWASGIWVGNVSQGLKYFLIPSVSGSLQSHFAIIRSSIVENVQENHNNAHNLNNTNYLSAVHD